MRLADLFISYSRRDGDFVRALHDALAKRGRDIWVDWEDIPPSVEWRDELSNGVNESDAVAFVISPDFLSSQECSGELERALAAGKRLVPLLYREPSDGETVPEALASRNWIFFRESDDFDSGVEEVQKALETDAGWMRDHTRLVMLAQEWQRRDRDRSLLLRGSDLNKAEQELSEWHEGKEPTPTAQQREYVAASRRGRSRRMGMLLVGTAVALVISVLLGVVALVARNNAVQREREAKSSALAVAGLQRVDSDPELSTLLALEALKRDRTPEAEEALRRAVSALQERVVWRPKGALHTDLSPRGGFLVASTKDGRILIRDTATGRVRQLDRRPGQWSVEVDNPGRHVLMSGVGTTARVLDPRTGAATVLTLPGKGDASAQFTRDASHVIGVGGDGQTRIWTPDGRLDGRPFHVPRTWDTFGASRDGRRLVVDDGGQVQAWDTKTGQRLGRQARYALGNSGSAISPDGRFVVSSRSGGRGIVWDAASGRVLAHLNGHAGTLVTADVSPDGRLIATGGSDNRVVLWDSRTGRELRVLRGHGDTVTSVTVSEDGHRVLSESMDGTVRIWFASTGEQDAVIRDPSGSFSEVRRTFDNRWIDTEAKDGTIRLWEASPGRTVAVLRHKGSIEAAALDPSGRYVASSGEDKLQLVRIAGDRTLFATKASEYTKGLTYDLAFDPTGRRLALGDGSAAFVIGLDGRYTYLNFGDAVNDVNWSSNGRRLIAASTDKTARVLDGRNAGRQLLPSLRHDRPVTKGFLTSDGRRAVTLTDDGTVHVWRLSDQREIAKRDFGQKVRDMAVSPDGRTIAAASEDSFVYLWHPATPRRAPLRLQHRYPANAVRFSRDGKRLATGSDDGTARVWDVASGRKLDEFTGHIDPVRDVDFSPDGRFLISASDDRTAKLWDTGTGRLVGVFGGHDARLSQARFAARGNTILTVPNSGTAEVFVCDACGSIDAVIARAHQLVPRKLTAAERRQFQT